MPLSFQASSGQKFGEQSTTTSPWPSSSYSTARPSTCAIAIRPSTLVRRVGGTLRGVPRLGRGIGPRAAVTSFQVANALHLAQVPLVGAVGRVEPGIQDLARDPLGRGAQAQA